MKLEVRMEEIHNRIIIEGRYEYLDVEEGWIIYELKSRHKHEGFIWKNKS